MGKVYESDLTIRGFRFLGGGGADDTKFDPQDVVADRNGEIIYEPSMKDCFEHAEKAFEDIVKTNSGSFTCHPKAYIYKDFYPIVKDWRTGEPERVVHERQESGFIHAMKSAAKLTERQERIRAITDIASAMATAGSCDQADSAGLQLRYEITCLATDREKLEAIRKVAIEIANKTHVDGNAEVIFESLLRAARMIKGPSEMAQALSYVVFKMKEEGCDVSDKLLVLQDAVGMAMQVEGNRKHYMARSTVARDTGAAGFTDYAVKLYDEMIFELEESKDKKALPGKLGAIFGTLPYARLGDGECDILSRMIGLIDRVEPEAARLDMIENAAQAMKPAAITPDYEGLFEELRSVAYRIGDDKIRERALMFVDRRESYVYEI